MACTCGHAQEEHGHDKENPGSTACTVLIQEADEEEGQEEELCDCIAYEEADEE